MMHGTSQRSRTRRVAATAAAGALIALIPFATAAADDRDGEKYPPAATQPPVTPTTRPALPKTGSDSTDTMLKFGAGALVAGGILATAGARRRAATTSGSGR